MPQSYSLDFRERVLKDCDAGLRSEDVAQKYSVSASWVYDLRRRRRETGSIAPKQQRHGRRPKLEPYEPEQFFRRSIEGEKTGTVLILTILRIFLLRKRSCVDDVLSPSKSCGTHKLSMIRAGLLLFLLLPAGLCAQNPCASPTYSEALFHFGNRERDRIFTDYSNLYNRNNVGNYGFALLGAGILANTELDRQFQNWHDQHMHSGFGKELGEFSKVFGEGKYFIPIMVSSAFTYRFLQEKSGISECKLGELTDRTMRGYFVGAPTLLTMQWVLGGDRPRDGESYWRPFQHDHGISGHAFMGAVPFITAAQMTDKPCVKGVFYVLSTFCAWSRINDDAHYLSQALLGWYLAYLSVRAVSATEGGRTLPRGLTIFPVTENNAVGVGLFYQY